MGLLDSVKGMLEQYGSGGVPTGDAAAHFQQVAQSVDSGTLAQGIAAAMRSDETAPFAQLVSQLFSAGSSDQKLAMLDTLLAAASPQQRAQLSALIPGLDAAGTTSGVQPTAISPAAIQTLAQHVEQHDSAIVEKMSSLYAAHPTLVKTLGTAAMMIALRKIAERSAPA